MESSFFILKYVIWQSLNNSAYSPIIMIIALSKC
nr:MAG TPA: hypothetical protein [Bacteriophage sp.]